jgi:hypothetical protein
MTKSELFQLRRESDGVRHSNWAVMFADASDEVYRKRCRKCTGRLYPLAIHNRGQLSVYEVCDNCNLAERH